MRDTLRPVLEEFSTFWQQKLVDTVDIEELRGIHRFQQLEFIAPFRKRQAFRVCLNLVAITEASSLPALHLNQEMTRGIFDSYAAPILWAGFNGPSRIVGAKFLIGEPRAVCMLAEVFLHLKPWHIDQQYMRMMCPNMVTRFMVLINIVTGAYKPTYNWGASHCSWFMNQPTWWYLMGFDGSLWWLNRNFHGF